MLKLEVIHYKGAVPLRPLSGQFGAQGGTIGRGDANTLVLPDAERFISRTHAKIKFQTGQYMIEDHGSSTPVMVNGRALGRGSEAGLAHGDELTIGEYQLRAIVQLVVASGGALEGAGAGTVRMDDPMAMFGSAPGADPFADLTPRATSNAKAPDKPVSAMAPDALGMPGRATQGGIPADFDPFANLGAPAVPAPQTSAMPGGSDPGFGVAGPSPSLDALFGLNPASASDPLGGAGPLATPVAAAPFTGAPSLDPLEAFHAKSAPSTAPVQRNDVPELFGSYVPPRAKPDPHFDKPAAAVPSATAARDIAPVPANATAEPAGAAASVAQPDPQPVAPTAASDEADAMAATQRVALVRPGADALVNAFLEGAGIANFNLPSGITPQNMNLLGQVLRETVQAMLDLLLARAMLKREMRAEVTMIVAQENNPLKFSPNVEAALMHLLSPQRGYMEPLEAVRDACNDLRSNQFAFMAGMRAALAGILQRFDPDQLEQRLKHKTMLDSLVPGNRKAKMWDLFSDLYGDVSKEAEDNFHEMFGREFVRAYEAQIAKLSSRGGGRP
jgi:FHA domain-containing protein